MAEDAIARARAIAAKLSGKYSAKFNTMYMLYGHRLTISYSNTGSIGGGLSSELGKRTADHAGLGSIIKKKIYIPVKENPDVNFLGDSTMAPMVVVTILYIIISHHFYHDRFVDRSKGHDYEGHV